MQWALIATEEQQIPDPNWDGRGEREMVTAIVGEIVNLIAYDGTSPYTPPSGTRLEQVPNDAKIGNTGY
jgi:hypothetical protein